MSTHDTCPTVVPYSRRMSGSASVTTAESASTTPTASDRVTGAGLMGIHPDGTRAPTVAECPHVDENVPIADRRAGRPRACQVMACVSNTV